MQKDTKRWASLPLTQAVSFKAVVQKNRRIHIPVVIRCWFKLESGEIFKVHLRLDHRYEACYGRMSTDGRLTVPKVTAKEFLESEEESLNGYTAEVTHFPYTGEGGRGSCQICGLDFVLVLGLRYRPRFNNQKLMT